MSKINDGGAAFPTFNAISHCDEGGMTLRDYFAAKALQGMASSSYWGDSVDADEGNLSMVATHAYAMADAMLSAREQQP